MRQRGRSHEATLRIFTRAILAALAGCLVLGWLHPAFAGERKILLQRKYQPGQQTSYHIHVQTDTEVHSNPPGLKSFLPAAPTRLTTCQQTTLRVREVRPDGSAEIESRFDRFELDSDLPDQLPDEVQYSAREAQEEFTRRLNGQTMTARYDRAGRLLGFEGAEEIFQGLDPPLRDVLRQTLRLFFEQMGGNALYPDHRIVPGEEWKHPLVSQPTPDYPFTVEGQSVLRYVGQAKFHGVKAAIINFKFENVLKPAADQIQEADALAQLEAHGMELDMRIEGKGEGRVLVALDGGRVLQNRTTLLQKLSARLQGLPGVPLPIDEPVTLEVDSRTELHVEETSKEAH